jgi:hypothetical protein
VLELDAGVIGREAPVGLGGAEVAVFDPGADLADEGFVVWDAPIEALGSLPIGVGDAHQGNEQRAPRLKKKWDQLWDQKRRNKYQSDIASLF